MEAIGPNCSGLYKVYKELHLNINIIDNTVLSLISVRDLYFFKPFIEDWACIREWAFIFSILQFILVNQLCWDNFHMHKLCKYREQHV